MLALGMWVADAPLQELRGGPEPGGLAVAIPLSSDNIGFSIYGKGAQAMRKNLLAAACLVAVIFTAGCTEQSTNAASLFRARQVP